MQPINQDENQQRPLCYTHKPTCYLEEHAPQMGTQDKQPLVYTCTLRFNTRRQQAGNNQAKNQQQS